MISVYYNIIKKAKFPLMEQSEFKVPSPNQVQHESWVSKIQIKYRDQGYVARQFIPREDGSSCDQEPSQKLLKSLQRLFKETFLTLPASQRDLTFGWISFLALKLSWPHIASLLTSYFEKWANLSLESIWRLGVFYQAGGYSLTDSAEVQYTILYTCTLAPSGVQQRNWLA